PSSTSFSPVTSLRQLHLRHPLESNLHRLDQPVSVKLHPLDARHTMVRIGFAERATVIDDIELITPPSREPDDPMMPRPGSNRQILLQDLADAPEGTQRRIGDRVRHAVIRPGPATLGPHEIDFALAPEHQRPLDIPLWRDLLERRSVRKYIERTEVVMQARD